MCELCWRPPSVRDERAIGYLLRIAAQKEWSQLKNEIYLAGSKAGRLE